MQRDPHRALAHRKLLRGILDRGAVDRDRLQYLALPHRQRLELGGDLAGRGRLGRRLACQRLREIVDVDFSGISFLDGTNLREDYRQFSQELRLTSPGGEAFNYIGGVYYQHAKLDVQDFTLFNPTFLGLGAPFNALGDTRNDRDYSQTSDLISAFAQGELSLTDQLRVTAGARFNHEKKSGRRSLAIVQGPLSTAPAAVVAAHL